MNRYAAFLSILTICAFVASATAQIDPAAPDFELKDTAGKAHKLADSAGKIVVLEWTNRECPVVQKHYKDDMMPERAKKWAAKGVVWLSIDSTAHAKPETVAEWRGAHKMEHPVLLDASGEVGRAYGAKTTPHMIIVKDGKRLYDGAIDDGQRGEATVNYVDQALDEILASKEVSKPSTTPYGCSVKYAKAAAKKTTETVWLTNYDEAVKLAAKEKKKILADFTGSDWCSWCKRLKSEVFETAEFKAWAAKNVVLLELDFPKKVEQGEELKRRNKELRERFGIESFPTVVLVDANGKESGRLGYVEGGPDAWIKKAEAQMK